jgi:hypothetical protein
VCVIAVGLSGDQNLGCIVGDGGILGLALLEMFRYVLGFGMGEGLR